MKKILSLLVAIMIMIVPVTSLAVEAEDVEVGYSDKNLEIGTGDYALSADYEYTVFTLEPAEAGEYVVTVENAVMGIVSYNGMWMTVVPDSTTVNANTVEWDCTNVGQSIWIAVKADSSTVSINVEKKELVVKEIEHINYQNTVTPEAFTFNGNADELLYVDTEDSVVDEAVMGADGYYHLNSVDGPILYANLSDSLMSLADALNYGQLKYVEYENGEAVSVTDYNEAFRVYLECADANTSLYPLTADIIEMYKMIGANFEWYGENGWVGGTEEDAWMFACYYVDAAVDNDNIDPDDTTASSGNTNNNVPGATNPDNNNSIENGNNAETTAPTTDEPVKSPQTGDNMMSVVAMATLALIACVVVVMKRRTAK